MVDAGNPDELTLVFMNLMNNSVFLASTYVKHANRTQITPIDIKKAMMVDYTNWDLLKDKRPKLQSIEDGITMPENANETFTASICDCELCSKFNQIENM